MVTCTATDARFKGLGANPGRDHCVVFFGNTLLTQCFYLTNKEAYAVYYTVIKDDGHLRTRGKCRKHELQASVFYMSRVFSNVRSVLSQCNTRLRILHLLYDIEEMWQKTMKHPLPMFYTLIKHGFSTNQSARRVLSIL